MLKSLEYSVTFPLTGRSLSNKINFQKGLGSITGPNESGKSFVLEMIRYSFFGSDALRGTGDGYKKLFSKMIWDDYTVQRKNGNATLWRKDEIIATGTRPVNDKILKILGFGLPVFDISCVANQGEMTKFGDMLPSARKRLVDTVIGMAVIDDITKWANDQALEKNKEADTVERLMVVPVAPVQPEGYQQSLEIQAQISNLTALKDEFQKLQGRLSVKRAEPTKPTTKIDLPAANLKEFADDLANKKATLVALKDRLRLIPGMPSMDLTSIAAVEDCHALYDRWIEKQKFLARYPEPKYTEAQLNEMMSQWDQLDAWNDNEVLRRQRQALLDKGHICCPSCKHEWPVMADELAKLPELDFVPQPTVPALKAKEIAHQFEILREYIVTLSEREAFQTILEQEKPKFSRVELETMKVAWARCADRELIEAQICDMEAHINRQPPYTEMYQERLAYEQALARYFEDQTQYDIWFQDQVNSRARVAEIEPLIAPLPSLQAKLIEAVSYEKAMEQFATATAKFNELSAEIVALRAEAEGWKSGREALSILRGLIKQHLVPSLNRVASSLIKAMTGGQRQKIEVDEEFNIMVDGQPVNTLSGSGKVVANLALRLGLGQVLTKNVMPIFMGDEVDASMDEDRAQNTANTLQVLKDRISQILIVTHKSFPSDYNINLGTSNDQLGISR